MRIQVYNRQEDSNTEYEVHRPEIFVGTSSTNDIVLFQPSLSGRHLKLTFDEDGGALVTDLDSRTGTYVNAERVNGTVALEKGDVISLGYCNLRVLTDKETEAAKKSAWERLISEGNRYDESLIPIKQEIHRRLIEFMNLRMLDFKKMEERELRMTTSRAIWSIMDSMGEDMPSTVSHEQVHKEMLDEVLGFGPIEDLIKDSEISEVMVNRKDQIFVEVNGKLYLTTRSFASDESLMGIIERIVSPLGRRIDESSPMVDARLKDGSRVNAIVPPLALKGPVLTIRKFHKEVFDKEKLMRIGAVTPEMMDFLREAVLHRKNIVISGGTSTGKTTLLNMLSSMLPRFERIVTIEDSAELQLPQEHVISLESRPANIQGKGEVTIRDLVRNSLRMRPDRIVVGEVRGGEALDMLQALNTGHDGSLTTGHANSPQDCLRRLETMVLMAGVDLPVRVIREQIASAVHVIIQLLRFSDGTRRVVEVCEMDGLDQDGSYRVKTVFRFKQGGIDENGIVRGTIVPTGYVPKLIRELVASGIDVRTDVYKTDEPEELDAEGLATIGFGTSTAG